MKNVSSNFIEGLQQKLPNFILNDSDPCVTDYIAVPSVDHVSEIVGRKGYKIKSLRARTNTYIKTPNRDTESVFIISGTPWNVQKARDEIMAESAIFSAFKSKRMCNKSCTSSTTSSSSSSSLSSCDSSDKNNVDNINDHSNDVFKDNCYYNNNNSNINNEHLEMDDNLNVNNDFKNDHLKSNKIKEAIGNFNAISLGDENTLKSNKSESTLSTDIKQMISKLNVSSKNIDSQIAFKRSLIPDNIQKNALSIEDNIEFKNQSQKPIYTACFLKVPYNIVGLLVGPKGVTIKEMQNLSGCYIVTPNRNKDPIFEIYGFANNINLVLKLIFSYLLKNLSEAEKDSINQIKVISKHDSINFKLFHDDSNYKNDENEDSKKVSILKNMNIDYNTNDHDDDMKINDLDKNNNNDNDNNNNFGHNLNIRSNSSSFASKCLMASNFNLINNARDFDEFDRLLSEKNNLSDSNDVNFGNLSNQDYIEDEASCGSIVLDEIFEENVKNLQIYENYRNNNNICDSKLNSNIDDTYNRNYNYQNFLETSLWNMMKDDCDNAEIDFESIQNRTFVDSVKFILSAIDLPQISVGTAVNNLTSKTSSSSSSSSALSFNEAESSESTNYMPLYYDQENIFERK